MHSIPGMHGISGQAPTQIIQTLHRQFQLNGHSNHTPLKWLEAEEVHKLEPDLRCTAALFSPTTGIVDAQRYVAAGPKRWFLGPRFSRLDIMFWGSSLGVVLLKGPHGMLCV